MGWVLILKVRLAKDYIVYIICVLLHLFRHFITTRYANGGIFKKLLSTLCDVIDYNFEYTFLKNDVYCGLTLIPQ